MSVIKILTISLLINILYMNLQCTNGQDTKGQIVYHPIGFFHTPYSPDSGAPRQGSMNPEKDGTIEILPEYRNALKDLDRYDFIIVLYHLDKIDSWSVMVRPGGIASKPEKGLFATRTPRRPNPIGFGVIKLHKIKKGILYISGMDAFDGTPVLDIKPYLPSIDHRESAKNIQSEKKLGL